MSSRTLRRRLHHGDVDGKRKEHLETSGLDSLSEPLLGGDDYSENKKVRIVIFFIGGEVKFIVFFSLILHFVFY